jgi:hypothetical protein
MLDNSTAWCCHNSLLINPDKTKVLVLGTHKMLQRLPDDFYVTLLEKRITPTISARDLGIQLDSTLSFNEHIANSVSTCIASLCQINRVKHLFDPLIIIIIITWGPPFGPLRLGAPGFSRSEPIVVTPLHPTFSRFISNT